MEFLVDFIYHQPPMVLLIVVQALWVICVVMGLGEMLVQLLDGSLQPIVEEDSTFTDLAIK